MLSAAFKELKHYKDTHIGKVSMNPSKLNHFHDQIMKMAVGISVKQTADRYGTPPSPFSFFVMGSAGRFEQSVWGDQDHGIIYQNQEEASQGYFLQLGEEISKGLYSAGYPYCDGRVMANQPLWCKSFPEWQMELKGWLDEASWKSIRHLLIFADGRVLFGNKKMLGTLKAAVFDLIEEEQLLPRIVHNTLHIKKGIGAFGQLLTEPHGLYAGSLNIKEIGLFPYVNAARLLAIKQKQLETSTLSRLRRPAWGDMKLYKQLYLKLLHYRLILGDHSDYPSGHYISVGSLTKEQKKEIKEIIKNGASFFYSVCNLIEQEAEL